MRIMIVDDAVFMRMVLRKIIEEAGYEVVGEASDGVEALKEYKHCRPDVVTMDLTMPVMDGITATKKIREYDPSAKILVTTSMGQTVMIKDAIISGAYDFVVKPVEQNRFLAALANAKAK